MRLAVASNKHGMKSLNLLCLAIRTPQSRSKYPMHEMLEAYYWILHQWQSSIGIPILEKLRTMYEDIGRHDTESQVMPAHRKGEPRFYYHLNFVCYRLFAEDASRGLLRLARMRVACRVINTDMVIYYLITWKSPSRKTCHPRL